MTGPTDVFNVDTDRDPSDTPSKYDGKLKVQVHHMVPKALWRRVRIKPLGLDSQTWDELKASIDKIKESGIGVDDFENTIPRAAPISDRLVV